MIPPAPAPRALPRASRRGLLAVLLFVVAVAAGLPGPARAEPLAPPAVVGPASPPAGWPPAPPLTARAHLLVDADSGQVLALHAADELVPVASTVKMLTALTVLQRVTLGDLVEVGTEVVGQTGASVGLRPGDEWTVELLLQALTARSGNDAAVALAVHVGGSEAAFVDLMRTDAAGLGLHGVTIDNPSGLHDTNLLSARDLAVIARVALADARYAAIAAMPRVELPRIGSIVSRNELLGAYPGASGVKTGFTSRAGYCLVASAQRDGRHLIAVVLGSPGERDHFADAAALLDFGFDAFDRVVVGQGTVAELRRPGGWVAARGLTPTALNLPVLDPALQRVATLPAELRAAATPATLALGWRDTELAVVGLEVDAAPPLEATGSAAVGEWLWDRAYTAMRAATAAGVWSG